MPPIRPQLPSGMRDFLPADMLRRQYVIDTIATVFETFGYEPLQTPALELSETLLGKMGDDAEKLIYYAQHPGGKEQLALRYDLTVPLARVFGMHEAKFVLPFRRYQIAPVWRGDRPQRGRFREFYQCDVDVIGVSSMMADAEMIQVVAEALDRLGFADFRIKINNRKLLVGIGEYAGLTGEALANLYRSIDKLDKIGVDGVREELLRAGIDSDAVSRVMAMLVNARPADAVGYAAGRAILGGLRETLDGIQPAMDGLNELDEMLTFAADLGVPDRVIELDLATVRGLGYYTGPVFEAVLISDDPEERVGSVAGGGRYDNLVGLFRKESLPTVGVSLGIERLITLLDRRNAYPPGLNRTVVQVLVSVFGPETRSQSLAFASELRRAGLRTEVVMQDARLGKQFAYADKKGIPLVAVVGPSEVETGTIKLKALATQTEITV
ncbi:MAG: histidine--tRNA ligase, partial [Anaerolineae bacterium]|nr:histidine--tRNA ligase [Anaerolineae bacterium]